MSLPETMRAAQLVAYKQPLEIRECLYQNHGEKMS
jgi:hypothetical protein